MPFYLRKSLSIGPIRFNLSKSGIGVSVGVTGLRLGAGPRGAYVHAGRHGLYFRKSLSRNRKRRNTESVQTKQQAAELFCRVGSGSVENMVDTDSIALLREILAARQNQTQVEIEYELDDETTVAFECLNDGILEIKKCERVWYVAGESKFADSARSINNAVEICRERLSIRTGDPSNVSTNILCYHMSFTEHSLYFLPDRILVFDSRGVGSVDYEDLEITTSTQNLVEEDLAFGEIVNHAWEHQNKDGSPDRRFKINRQFPVCVYEVLNLGSKSGITERIVVSDLGATARFVEAIRNLSAAINDEPLVGEAAAKVKRRIEIAEQLEKERTEEIRRALFEVMCCIMVCDRRAAVREKRIISRVAKIIGLYDSSSEVDAQITAFIKRVGDESYTAILMRQLALLKSHNCEDIAVQCVTHVADADEKLTKREKDLCSKIQDTLNADSHP